MAHHDALTELPNRLLFSDRLHHVIERAERAERDEQAIALLFIDLDHFKTSMTVSAITSATSC